MTFTKIELVLQERRLLDALFQRYDEYSQKIRIGERLPNFRPKMQLSFLGCDVMEMRLSFKRKKTQIIFEEEYFLKNDE